MKCVSLLVALVQNKNGAFSARHKSAVTTNLPPQFFSQCVAFLEAIEERFKGADDDCIYADAFGLGPILEREPGLFAAVEELTVESSMPALPVCLISTLSLTTWLKTKGRF